MSSSRRDFLRQAGVIAAAGMGIPSAARASGEHDASGSWGMLIDLTLCIGCRKCEFACRQTNSLAPLPIETFEDKSVFKHNRRIEADSVTVVNAFRTDDAKSVPEPAGGEHVGGSETARVAESRPATSASQPQTAGPRKSPWVYVKNQCMHCNQPACASACPVGAIRKTAQGPVVYQSRTCIGCRYCMMACPFSMLAYTYDDPLTPVVRKCTMCFERIGQGEVPACAKICPVEAITFGRRRSLLALARDRILTHPERYVNHIYGEQEVGGTSVLYLSPQPFEELGFRTDLGTTPPSELTARFMSMVPLVVSIWPALLTGVYTLTRRRQAHGAEHTTHPAPQQEHCKPRQLPVEPGVNGD